MAPRRPTQRDRVLSALRVAGEHGVRSTDFLHPVGGHPPILRVASRISELRDLGYDIQTRRTENGTAEYRLRSWAIQPVEPAPESQPVVEAGAPPADRLFDTDVAEGRS
jgi:hypothetical protein